jgi:hypothetical protein
MNTPTTPALTQAEYRDEQVKFNKAMRAELDSTLQKVKGSPSSRERSLVITKIQEAVMWLGMDLKRLNGIGNAIRIAEEPNPYPTSYDPTSAKVEPTADGLTL